MRFDPHMMREDVLAALIDDAVDAWGAERAATLRASLDTTAQAIWTVAQEALDPTDVEP